MVLHCPLFFFFSSRRRHTRWPRDWSSDVCSSDLPPGEGGEEVVGDEVCSSGPATADFVASAFSAASASATAGSAGTPIDRKSTRLNSSHVAISYAVFCLKKKNHVHSINLMNITCTFRT